MNPRSWDAEAYHRVSDVQFEWARRVLERLPLRGDEAVLDAGCGSGRVTALLVERLPDGRVIGVDSSADMVEHARATLGDGAEVFVADLTELELEEPVDAIFSNAVFHWVPDHERLFARLHAALKPGGRLVAQCGGRGNIEAFIALVDEVRVEAPFAEHLADFQRTWRFPGADKTAERLRQAGFEEIRTWLERSRVVRDDPADFLTTVVLGVHLDGLPEELHDPFVDAILARVDLPLELDYIRLNIDAVRPA